MWWDVPHEARADWEDWHTREHMPERAAIPGFLRGSRWISGESSYFVLYEAERMSVLTEGAYVARLNEPTPWSRRMMPYHRNMVRTLCHVRGGFGGGLGQVMATVRLSARHEPKARQGVTGMDLLEALPESEVPKTTEQKIRGGGDARADWVLLVCGYDVEAVRAAASEARGTQGLYRLSYTITPKDLPR
jgi:hypothetical protein